MKKIILLLICWPVIACSAQGIDSAARLAETYFKEASVAGKNQKLWHAQLYGPTLFVDRESRTTYANMPDSAGILKRDGEIYKGILPKEVMVANTAITWEGRLWSVILWPLPANHDDCLNLMMHESFHRVQEKLGLPASDPTAEHLGTLNGRIYFLLELQALKAALSKPVDQRSADLRSALLFRMKRQELFPKTFNNEGRLEMNEGLAEFTGVVLGRAPDSIKKHLDDIIDHAAERPSLIRFFPYLTGPVYGYLLYQKNPQWTWKVDSNSRFPALIAANYHLRTATNRLDKAVAASMNQYGGKEIVRTENLKEEEHQKTLRNYVTLFTKQPVLTIRLKKMRIGFNPSNMFDLGAYGTVYPTAQVADNWGQVNVSANGLLMKDWSVITLSAEGISVNGSTIEGKGWELTLNKGWEMVKTDALHYGLVEKK